VPVSTARAVAAALLLAGPVAATPTSDAADDPAAPRGPPRARLAGKVGARGSYRPLFGIPIYGGGPSVLVGARVASGRVGLYGAPTAFFGRTQAGLDVGGLATGFEVELHESGFSYGFGTGVGAMSIPRASTDGALSALVVAQHVFLAVDLLRRRRGPMPYLEGRGSAEAWLGQEESDETVFTLAPSLLLGLRF